MSRHTLIRWSALAAAMFIMVATLAPLAAASAPAGIQPTPDVAGNLLVNPGFESPYVKQCCQADLSIYLANTPIDEVQVARGWSAWWREPDSAPQYPSRCDLPTSAWICAVWHRPEWREAAPFANRIHSGQNAQKYFTFWSVHEAGLYQRVSGLQPGQRLQFSVYLSAWSTNAPGSPFSAGQQSMNFRLGIDPFGGTNPFSSNIVWSRPGDSYDTFSQFSVQATAARSAVTVFIYSRPVYPLQHNDVYVDDAALVVVGLGSIPFSPAGSAAAGGGVGSSGVGGSGSTSSSAVAAGPFPGTTLDQKTGDILYVVQFGDTTFSLAQRFNTTVGSIVKWNNLQSADVLRAGKTIIVGKTRR